MTGTVHFDVPVSSLESTPQRLPARRLLRPVSMEEADNSVNEIHESLPRRAAVRLYRQISSGFNSKTIRCILVVSLCLNLIFAVLIGIFVGFWKSSKEFEGAVGPLPQQPRYNLPGAVNQMVCLPCTDQGIPGLAMYVRSKNGVCCTSDTVPGYDQAERMLQMTRDYVMEKVNCKQSGADAKTLTTPAAHLTLDVSKSIDNLRDLPSEKHYLVWNTEDNSGSSFLSDDLHYANGSITIPSSGRYHVYTHLTFDTNSNQLSVATLLVDHSIKKMSRGRTEPLLLDRVNLKQREIKSSDLEGTFELKQGDVIKVVVSYPSYLYNVAQTNVFGLFKLVSG